MNENRIKNKKIKNKIEGSSWCLRAIKARETHMALGVWVTVKFGHGPLHSMT
jgi:hypothetical protein